VDASGWFRCVVFKHGANFFAKFWYSGCSFIVHGIKYVLFLFLCDVGCVLSKFGIGPGLVSMSPESSSSSSFGMWYLMKFGLMLVLFLLGRCFLFFLRGFEAFLFVLLVVCFM
jgi:hypothetical protein